MKQTTKFRNEQSPVTVSIVRCGDIKIPELPYPETIGSAGMDLVAAIENDLILYPMATLIVPTGIKIALPIGLEAQIRPRSGLAAKQSITVLNSPGTIDSDFRGEIKVILINLGQKSYTIKPLSRIAQMVVAEYVTPVWLESDDLNHTERGESGLGSTGS
jgi:dUTP pyrophosphatase